jgi:hypothetical protein
MKCVAYLRQVFGHQSSPPVKGLLTSGRTSQRPQPFFQPSMPKHFHCPLVEDMRSGSVRRAAVSGYRQALDSILSQQQRRRGA